MYTNQFDFKGLGEFNNYKAFKFPDGSLKVILQPGYIANMAGRVLRIDVDTKFRTNDDILLLGLLCDALQFAFEGVSIHCRIWYMMYQQDDRRFDLGESYGLKFICDILNSYPIDKFSVFHPHSDKVEFLKNCHIISNDGFVKEVLKLIPSNSIWIIPDAGASKIQLKQSAKLAPTMDFEIAAKSRPHVQDAKLIQKINRSDFNNQPCIIFDDMCLGGATFLGLYDLLKERNAGDIYLAVSHGIFNTGIDHLIPKFKYIFTTNSITTLQPNEHLSIFDLNWNPISGTSPWL